MKCIGQVTNFANISICQQHLNDVETNFDLRLPKQLQVIETALRKEPSLTRIHGSGRTHPIFRRSSLYFDKHETILLAENQIDFTARRAEVRCEKFQPEFLEM